MSDIETMGKVLLLIILITHTSDSFASSKKISSSDQMWMVYEVYESHTLWKFARNLNVQEKHIPHFVQHLVNDNPWLDEPNKIEPGYRILVRESLLNEYVSREKQFRTFWIKPNEERQLASKQKLVYKKDESGFLFVQPRFLYSRIDARQRGSNAEASLVSSMNLGLNFEYNWINRWGPNGIGLNLDWVQYDENFGSQIDHNELLSLELEWQQYLQLSQSWQMTLGLGYYQSAYLFTDQNDNLFLKLASQPGASVGINKDFVSIKTQISLRARYLYFGYAGDTFIEDGLGLKLQSSHLIESFDLKWQLSFWGQRDLLLSEVTEQDRSALGLGLGYTW